MGPESERTRLPGQEFGLYSVDDGKLLKDFSRSNIIRAVPQIGSASREQNGSEQGETRGHRSGMRLSQ